MQAETGSQMHAGEQALACLSSPLSFEVLRTLAEGPSDPETLRRAAGSPPTSTMRVYMKTLDEFEIIWRERQKSFPGTVTYTITPSGEKLLEVGGVLQQWLQNAPHGPVSLGTPAAKAAIKALLGGWSSYGIRVLAAKPLKLVDLHGLLPNINYPALERRLNAMRHVGLLERPAQQGRGNANRPTPWMRQAAVPLAVAIGWEQEYLRANAAPVARVDVEAIFLLLARLLKLPRTISGMYRLAVELSDGSVRTFAGVSLTMEEGQVAACAARWENDPDVVVTGSVLAWLRWLIEKDESQMEIEGDRRFVRPLAKGIRDAPHWSEQP